MPNYTAKIVAHVKNHNKDFKTSDVVNDPNSHWAVKDWALMFMSDYCKIPVNDITFMSIRIADKTVQVI